MSRKEYGMKYKYLLLCRRARVTFAEFKRTCMEYVS